MPPEAGQARPEGARNRGAMVYALRRYQTLLFQRCHPLQLVTNDLELGFLGRNLAIIACDFFTYLTNLLTKLFLLTLYKLPTAFEERRFAFNSLLDLGLICPVRVIKRQSDA